MQLSFQNQLMRCRSDPVPKVQQEYLAFVLAKVYLYLLLSTLKWKISSFIRAQIITKYKISCATIPKELSTFTYLSICPCLVSCPQNLSMAVADDLLRSEYYAFSVLFHDEHHLEIIYEMELSTTF